MRLVRTAIEATVLAVGWLLGGSVGVGTLLYAFGIGPLVQMFLRDDARRACWRSAAGLRRTYASDPARNHRRTTGAAEIAYARHADDPRPVGA